MSERREPLRYRVETLRYRIKEQIWEGWICIGEYAQKDRAEAALHYELQHAYYPPARYRIVDTELERV